MLDQAKIALANLSTVGITQRPVERWSLCAQKAVRQNRLKLPPAQLCLFYLPEKLRHICRSKNIMQRLLYFGESLFILNWKNCLLEHCPATYPLYLILERETGIEPATNSLEGCDSTTELLPRYTPQGRQHQPSAFMRLHQNSGADDRD
jgi:hypothetical protein